MENISLKNYHALWELNFFFYNWVELLFILNKKNNDLKKKKKTYI